MAAEKKGVTAQAKARTKKRVSTTKLYDGSQIYMSSEALKNAYKANPYKKDTKDSGGKAIAKHRPKGMSNEKRSTLVGETLADRSVHAIRKKVKGEKR